MKMILKCLLLLLGSAISCQFMHAQKMDAKTFDAKLNASEAPQLIDVRTPEEFANGHLNNARNINWNGDSFDAQVAQLDPSKPVFVYCQGGGRSAAASTHLKKLGFTQINDLDGGIMAWRAAKLPESAAAKTETGLSVAAYEKLLEGKQMVLIDFYADWCIPCKKMKPFLEKMEQDKKLNITIIRINADEHAALATELNIDGLPYLKLYKSKKEIWEHKGFIEEKDLRKAIETLKK